MNAEQTEQRSLYISQEQLLTLVRALISGSRGRVDDEHPLPPGPWDPIIRVALERINVFGPRPQPWRSRGSIFGPRPEPWQVVFAGILARHPEIWDAIGGGHSFGEEVALNPQPLPPRSAFLVSVAQTVMSRVELLQEIADATRRAKAKSKASSLSPGISLDLLMIFVALDSGRSGRSQDRRRLGSLMNSTESIWW